MNDSSPTALQLQLSTEFFLATPSESRKADDDPTIIPDQHGSHHLNLHHPSELDRCYEFRIIPTTKGHPQILFSDYVFQKKKKNAAGDLIFRCSGWKRHSCRAVIFLTPDLSSINSVRGRHSHPVEPPIPVSSRRKKQKSPSHD